MIRITEDDFHRIVHMHCTRCGMLKNIETNDAKFAYREINKFRKEHEHLEKRGGVKWKEQQKEIDLDYLI